MPEVTLKTYESQIDQMIEESRYIEGLAHVRHLLSQYPRYVGAYYLLGKAMLEADQPEFAVDLFRRALNANPEHLVSRIGLGLAHQKLDELDAAIWNLERAFELEPGNSAIAEELRHVYGARDGVIPDSVTLSRAGLARMYIRAERYDRAANELQKLVDDNPDRPDLLTALAEAYWRAGQIVQASEIGQHILDYFPYNIKANLLMASLWGGEDAEESQIYLRRAGDVDPEGTQATDYMGTQSPLAAKEVLVDRLVYDPGFSDVDTEARWYHQLEAMSVGVGISEAPPEMSETEVRLVDITAGLESQIEIPDWLRDMGGTAGGDESGADLGWDLDFGGQEAFSSEQIEDTLLSDAFDSPALDQVSADLWTEDLDDTAPDTQIPGKQSWEELLTADQAEESPDWLSEMQSDGAIETLDELPDFAENESDLVEDMLDGDADTGKAATGAAFFEEDVDESSGLDWLYGGSRDEEPDAIEEIADEGSALDWLQSIETQKEETPEVQEAFADEGLDWLQEVTETPAVEETEEFDNAIDEVEAAVAETAEDSGAIDWLTSLPSAEDESDVQIPDASDTLFAEEVADIFEETTEISEPALDDGAESLDWLSSFGPITGDASGETDDEALEGAPDWLRQLRPATPAEIEEEPDEGLFDNLETEEDETEPEPAAKTADENIPDWMQAYTKKHGQTGILEMPDWMDKYAPATSRKQPAVEPDIVDAEVPAANVEMFGWHAFGDEIAEVKPVVTTEQDTGMVDEVVESATVDESLSWLQDAEQVDTGTEFEASDFETSMDWAQDTDESPDAAFLTSLEAEGEEIPDWPEKTSDATFLETPDAMHEDDDWLSGVGETLLSENAAPPVAETAKEPVEQFPEWLQEFSKKRDTAPFAELIEENESGQSPEDAVDWLQDFGAPSEVSGEVAGTADASDADQALSELFGETEGDDSMLSGDSALAWLESLAAGKEDELRTQAEAEQQDRLAELLGRPKAVPQVEETPADLLEEPEFESEVEFEPVDIIEEPEAAEAVDIEALEDGDMMSGADALAWLASLSAGKEDTLRAQAEVEQQDRLAELLGRPKAAPQIEEALSEPEPEPAEIIEEPEAAETVDIEALEDGDMISGADALAWLASLSAGKEDALRAQAEVEQQDRLAELLGRPKAAPQIEESPSEPEPAEIIEEPEVAEIIDIEALEDGDMMAGTDALAWLASLSAGKEDELRAQAEVEQQERLAELLGRPKAIPQEEESPIEAVAEPEPEPEADRKFSDVVVKLEPGTGILEVQKILEEPSGTADDEFLDDGDMMSGADALAFLKGLSAGKEDKLRASAEAEQQARLAELLGRPRVTEPVIEETPFDEAIEEETALEGNFLEEAPQTESEELETLLGAPVEAYVEESTEEFAETVADIEPGDYVDQDDESFDAFEAGILIEEDENLDLEDVVEEIVEEPVVFDALTEDALVEELTESEIDLQEPTTEEELAVTQEVPAEIAPVTTKPVSKEQPPATAGNELEEMADYLKRKRSDHPARLNYARALWDAGDRGESINHYARLIKSGALMDEVLADLQNYAESGKETVLVLRSLGDAYMKLGDLDQALSYFNRAQNIL